MGLAAAHELHVLAADFERAGHQAHSQICVAALAGMRSLTATVETRMFLERSLISERTFYGTGPRLLP